MLLLVDVLVLVGVALDGVVLDQELDALVKGGAAVGDGFPIGDFRWISGSQTHQVVRAGRI